MPERTDPWNTTGRPRSSMMTFAGAPWKKPKPFEYISGPTVHPRPEYLRVYKRFLGLPDNSQAPRKSSGSGFTNNYVQSELNPGVAMDNSTQKYRLLLFENGIPVAKGAFFTDEDAMQGYSGYTDMMTKGPHGIHGVPLSASNNGPPGVALAPLENWRQNKGFVPLNRKGTKLLPHKGYYVNEVPNHVGLVSRPDAASIDLPAIASAKPPKTEHVPTVMEMRMMSSRSLLGL